MRTFEFNDGKSHKFWNIDLQEESFTVTFGKVGTKGQTQTKDFPSEAAAQKEHDKLVAEKLKKGYAETTAGAAPVATPGATPLQQSMEEALVEHPDELANSAAYADYLHDQGDPRGEFIQAQLALEDPNLAAAERARLQKREAELLKKNAKRWLGDLGRFLVGKWSGPDKPFHYAFHRGWLDHLRVLPAPEALFPVLAAAPATRLLRTFEIVYDMRYHPFDFDQFLQGPNAAIREGESESDDGDMYEETTILPSLLASPYLTNLRSFKFGFSDDQGEPQHSTMISVFNDCTVQQVIDLLAKCPRLEELYLNTGLRDVDRLFSLPSLGTLRLLQYYYGMDDRYDAPGTAYPLSAIANNPAFTKLTTIRLHPGRDASIATDELDALVRSPNLPALTHLQARTLAEPDEAARRIAASGILGRLQTLDLGYADLTDAGARALAESPGFGRLKALNVSRTQLTEEGVALLRAPGVAVQADHLRVAEGDYDNYYDVDAE